MAYKGTIWLIILFLFWIDIYLVNNLTKLFIKSYRNFGITKLFIKSYSYFGLTNVPRHPGFVRVNLQSSFSPWPVACTFTAFTPHLYALSLSLFYWISISIVLIFAIGILLSGFMDSMNRFLGRERKDKKFMESYEAKHKRGSNDGRVVDLSFFNISTNMVNPDPESPSKVIFDKNDPTGSLLPILFPARTAYTCEFLRDGVLYRGFTDTHFASAAHQAGTLERVNTDTYITYVKAPSILIMNELNSRGIFVFSGNQPIRIVLHAAQTARGNSNLMRQIHIYANRRDAIGVFNPNDPNILPN